jgi:hypothetical protein
MSRDSACRKPAIACASQRRVRHATAMANPAARTKIAAASAVMTISFAVDRFAGKLWTTCGKRRFVLSMFRRQCVHDMFQPVNKLVRKAAKPLCGWDWLGLRIARIPSRSVRFTQPSVSGGASIMGKMVQPVSGPFSGADIVVALATHSAESFDLDGLRAIGIGPVGKAHLRAAFWPTKRPAQRANVGRIVL